MKQCLAFGTIIVPLWRSTSFWLILSPSGEGFIKEVKRCINLPTNKIFFDPGKGKKGVLGNIDLPFRMLALKIDYKKSKFISVLKSLNLHFCHTYFSKNI
jgi:hypothetical protein